MIARLSNGLRTVAGSRLAGLLVVAAVVAFLGGVAWM